MKSLIWSNSDGNEKNLPWLLTKHKNNDVNEVIQRINFPTCFCSKIKNILTKKSEFGVVKTNDWHTFIKVINNFSIHIYILSVYIFWDFCFLCRVLKQVIICFYWYSMFYLYLSQVNLTTMSNKLYMILENTWGK
jgi:hypothetical protein